MGVRWLDVIADAPVRKDSVMAIAGAAALGGLVLVFLGVVVAGYGSYGGGTSGRVLRPFRIAIGALFTVFVLSLGSVALAVTWLATYGGAGVLYEATLWTFFSVLLAVPAVAVVTIYRVVLS